MYFKHDEISPVPFCVRIFIFFKWNSGLALIRKNEALLWMDGRYFFQAGQELSAEWKLMRIGEDPAVDIWMADVSVLLVNSILG